MRFSTEFEARIGSAHGKLKFSIPAARLILSMIAQSAAVTIALISLFGDNSIIGSNNISFLIASLIGLLLGIANSFFLVSGVPGGSDLLSAIFHRQTTLDNLERSIEEDLRLIDEIEEKVRSKKPERSHGPIK